MLFSLSYFYKGTESIQAVVLNLPEPYEARWNPEAFSKMGNLRLLMILNKLHLPLGLKCLPSGLKVLAWSEYPLESLPIGDHLDELVDLDMCHSKIKQLWRGTKVSFFHLISGGSYVNLRSNNVIIYLFSAPGKFKDHQFEKFQRPTCNSRFHWNSKS